MNNDRVKVLIAIQARSNSTRFPQKIYQTIGKKPVLQHVIDSSLSSKRYISMSTHKKKIDCDVAVLHPITDHQVINFCKGKGILLIGGDEENVLSRFLNAFDQCHPDFIVRLTSDCPLILDFVITKHINVAVLNDLDYVSNVEESCRLAFDGLDCEVLSRNAVEWLRENATSIFDKEHVTTAIRRERPRELSQGFVSFKLDNSSLKLSLDTPDDLDRIRDYFHKRETKMTAATKMFGKRFIYEL